MKPYQSNVRVASLSGQKNSSSKSSEFINRFEGRITQIKKDGHIGIVASTRKPIQKAGGGVQYPHPEEDKQYRLRLNEKQIVTRMVVGGGDEQSSFLDRSFASMNSNNENPY
jgi:hypothetical protein